MQNKAKLTCEKFSNEALSSEYFRISEQIMPAEKDFHIGPLVKHGNGTDYRKTGGRSFFKVFFRVLERNSLKSRGFRNFFLAL